MRWLSLVSLVLAMAWLPLPARAQLYKCEKDEKESEHLMAVFPFTAGEGRPVPCGR